MDLGLLRLLAKVDDVFRDTSRKSGDSGDVIGQMQNHESMNSKNDWVNAFSQ